MANRVCVTYGNREKLEPYLAALRGVGLEPVPVGLGESIALGEVVGLVITGGGDIDPGRYHEPPHSETKNVNERRDDLEDRLLREALAADLPALAICRGLQMLNVVRGGTLIQHLPDTATHRAPGKPEAHEVKIEPGSRLRAILETDACMVNSRHHQGIGRLGEGLKIAATSPDQVIEAIEIPSKRFVAPTLYAKRRYLQAAETEIPQGCSVWISHPEAVPPKTGNFEKVREYQVQADLYYVYRKR